MSKYLVMVLKWAKHEYRNPFLFSLSGVCPLCTLSDLEEDFIGDEDHVYQREVEIENAHPRSSFCIGCPLNAMIKHAKKHESCSAFGKRMLRRYTKFFDKE